MSAARLTEARLPARSCRRARGSRNHHQHFSATTTRGGKTDDRATKAYAGAGGPRHVMRKERGMAREREVVVGRVGRVLRTPGG